MWRREKRNTNLGGRSLLGGGLERLGWKNDIACSSRDAQYFSNHHFGTACGTKSPGDYDKVDQSALLNSSMQIVKDHESLVSRFLFQ